MRTVRTTRNVRIPSANNPHPGSVSFKRVVDPPRLETYIFGGKIACVHKTGIEIKVGGSKASSLVKIFRSGKRSLASEDDPELE